MNYFQEISMRMLRPSLALVVVLAVLAGPAGAQTVPTKVNFTARMVESGAPVQGTRDFVFKLFPTIMGGTEVWSEMRSGISITDGVVNLDLGASTPLTTTILDGQTLYLEVTVAGTALSPRTAVLSVPYAVRSTVAAQVGTLTAAQIQQRVASNCGAGAAIQTINADGTVVCQAIGANDAGVTSITNITAGTGLTGGGSTGNVSLAVNFTGSTGTANAAARSDHTHTGVYLPLSAALTCASSEKVVGINPANGSVVCATDSNTTYGAQANGGLTLNGSNQFSLTACAPNQILVVGTSGSWNCAAPPSVTGNAPITVTGNAVSLNTCNNGEILKMSGGAWRCMTDDNSGGTVSSVSASAPLTSTGGNAPTISLGVVPVGNGGAGVSLAATGGARQFVKQVGPGAPLSVGTILPAELPTHPHAGSDINSGFVAVNVGGTGANLGATGGPGQVVKQAGPGSPLSVGVLAPADLPAGTQVWGAQPSCPAGQYLAGINNNGAPVCVPVPSFVAVYSGSCNAAVGSSCTIPVPGAYAVGSVAGNVTQTHNGTGSYSMSVPWISNGVPQVTTYSGTGSVLCRSGGYGIGPPFTASVICTTAANVATDAIFNFSVMGN